MSLHSISDAPTPDPSIAWQSRSSDAPPEPSAITALPGTKNAPSKPVVLAPLTLERSPLPLVPLQPDAFKALTDTTDLPEPKPVAAPIILANVVPFPAPAAGARPPVGRPPLVGKTGDSVARMLIAKAWDYPAMRDALCDLPVSDRAEALSDFKARFCEANSVPRSPEPPFFALLDMHARGGIAEPTTDAELTAFAAAVCRPPSGDLREIPRPAAAAFDRALEKAAGIAHLQEVRADKLARADDPRGIFARMYQRVTEEEIKHNAIEGSPAPWLNLVCIEKFETYYSQALAADDAHRLDKSLPGAEPHWANAFAIIRSTCAMDDAKKNGVTYIADALVPCMFAHIRGDLGRGLADAYRELYVKNGVSQVPLENFRKPFLSQSADGSVFSRAQTDFSKLDVPKILQLPAVMQLIPDRAQALALEYPVPATVLRATSLEPFAFFLPEAFNPSFRMDNERTKAFNDAVKNAGAGIKP